MLIITIEPFQQHFLIVFFFICALDTDTVLFFATLAKCPLYCRLVKCLSYLMWAAI